MVGFNLGKSLSLLNVEHNDFIDLMYLFPHPFPKRQTLRFIAQDVLLVSLPYENSRGYRREEAQYRRERVENLRYDSSDDERREDRYRRPRS